MENIVALTHKFSRYEKYFIAVLEKMNRGYLEVTLSSGQTLGFGDINNELHADIQIISNGFYKKLFLYGDIGFGEAYVDGDWETSNVTSVISWVLLNIENSPAVSGSKASKAIMNIFKWANRVAHVFNNNSETGSQKNIAYHYDLSNDFYSLWLDKSMTYSSGYFADNSTSLHDAQIEKYRKLADKLDIKDGDHILEIGCGWGGMAEYLAINFDVKVTGVTISKEQFEFAKTRMINKNLSDKVDIVFQDYRKVQGKFDKVVSIEMLEAVGHKYYKSFFQKVHQLLKPQGVLALQVITSPDSRYDEMRKGVDFIQKHIFPGSLLPSVGILNENVNNTGDLTMYALEDMGHHYARTLKIWRERFNSKLEEIDYIGFDEVFVRKWNYYFSYCEAAFSMRNINVMQLVYSRPNNTGYKKI